MPALVALVRIQPHTVVRESDGATLLVVEGYLGDQDVPAAVQVIEPPDDEE